MRKGILVLFLSLLSLSFLRASDGERAVTLRFYSERINLSYNTDIVLPFTDEIHEKSIVAYYQQLQRQDHRTLLRALQDHKKNLQLNDWLFYQLLRQTVMEIMAGHSNVQQELTSWFLLSQAGFDTRLTFHEEGVYLYVYTTEEVFEVPMIQENGRTYINLTSIHRGEGNGQQALYLLNFTAKPQGRPFSFYLSRLPRLRPQLQSRVFEFSFGEYVYQVDVTTDETIVQIMKNYPFIAENQYLEVPFSSSVSSSLLPQLRKMIQGKTEREALEFLVAFTRSSFQYQDDKDYFGYSKPMIADEVFHYPYSDCEDRSALFYRLVRELLDLPMIVIAYQDHLTIGVALSESCEDAIEHQGRRYCVCDPTGPVNSTTIGRAPRGYEYAPYHIIGQYK